MSSRSRLQAVLTDYAAYLSGGEKALEQSNRIRSFLKNYPASRYSSVIYQLIIFLNTEFRWSYSGVADETKLNDSELYTLAGQLQNYRSTYQNSESSAEYHAFVSDTSLPHQGDITFEGIKWGLPDVTAAPAVSRVYQHSDRRFHLVSSPAGEVSFVLPNNLASSFVTVRRLVGTLAGQANAEVKVAGIVMQGDVIERRMNAGQQITIGPSVADAYDIVEVVLTNTVVNRTPIVALDMGKRLGLLASKPVRSIAKRVFSAVLEAAGVANLEALLITNDKRAVAPLAYCAIELCEIASVE